MSNIQLGIMASIKTYAVFHLVGRILEVVRGSESSSHCQRCMLLLSVPSRALFPLLKMMLCPLRIHPLPQPTPVCGHFNALLAGKDGHLRYWGSSIKVHSSGVHLDPWLQALARVLRTEMDKSQRLQLIIDIRK